MEEETGSEIIRYYVTVEGNRIVSKVNPVTFELGDGNLLEVDQQTYESLTDFPYAYVIDDDGKVVDFKSMSEEAPPIIQQPTRIELLEEADLDNKEAIATLYEILLTGGVQSE